jgi:hypothetical protein
LKATYLKVAGQLFHNGLPCYETFDKHICGLEVLELDVFLDEALVAAERRVPAAPAGAGRGAGDGGMVWGREIHDGGIRPRCFSTDFIYTRALTSLTQGLLPHKTKQALRVLRVCWQRSTSSSQNSLPPIMNSGVQNLVVSLGAMQRMFKTYCFL